MKAKTRPTTIRLQIFQDSLLDKIYRMSPQLEFGDNGKFLNTPKLMVCDQSMTYIPNNLRRRVCKYRCHAESFKEGAS